MPIVCGIHPVLEALAAGSRTIERVVVTKGVRNKRILEVIKRASERGVPLRFEPREALDRVAEGERHQGVLALVADKGLLTLEELQKSARTPPLFMLLDGVEDPRNLGAIIRSVDAAGADGVILPDRHTASLSDAASRTAAGALESVKIARIGNVVQALEALKAKGFWIVGFDGSGKERWDSIDYKRPIVLVLGGEGKGIRRLVKEHCDHIVSLPVFGQVSSLNVSVAAGIALYEAVRQRGSVPTLARPIPPRALVAKKPVVIGPPPEDREEDPGAKRRAAAIASLVATVEPPRKVASALPAEGGPVEPVAATRRLSGPEEIETEPGMKEASLEPVGPVDERDTDDEAHASRAAATDEQGDDRDRDDDDDESDADRGDEDDAEDADDDEDEDGEAGGEGEDDDADDDDDDDDDEGEDDEDDEDDGVEDPGDVASDLATPFMPEDNSGGGEVTWGSEKELHAHRPRREGERRFGNNGGRRSGRPNDRNKRPRPQGAGAASPGPKPEGSRPQGQSQVPAKPGGRDPNQNRNQQQQRRGPDRPRERRPSEGEAPGGAPPGAREQTRSLEAPRPEGGIPTDSSAPLNGGENRGADQPRDPNRPGRRRNRRRRGGRGRSGSGTTAQGDPTAPQGPPREGDAPREGNREPRDRGPRPPLEPRPQGDLPTQGDGSVGEGKARPAGDRQGSDGGGARGRDRHRRRRRGGRGPKGGQGGGPGQGGAGGNGSGEGGNPGGSGEGGFGTGGSSGGGGESGGPAGE